MVVTMVVNVLLELLRDRSVGCSGGGRLHAIAAAGRTGTSWDPLRSSGRLPPSPERPISRRCNTGRSRKYLVWWCFNDRGRSSTLCCGRVEVLAAQRGSRQNTRRRANGEAALQTDGMIDGQRDSTDACASRWPRLVRRRCGRRRAKRRDPLCRPALGMGKPATFHHDAARSCTPVRV